MILRCRHRGCPVTLERQVNHLVYLRLAARKLGWGYTFQVHTQSLKFKALDYCPEHKTDANLR